MTSGSKKRRRLGWVRVVSLIVLACDLAGGCSAQREREATLRQNLVTMRQAIDNYTLGKKRVPQSLQDLVNEHYLKEIPTDPFTEAEIADESGKRVAIVYEASNGWHTELLGDWVNQAPASLDTFIENAKEVLSHYVNRRGDKCAWRIDRGGALSVAHGQRRRDSDGEEVVVILKISKSTCPVTRLTRT